MTIAELGAIGEFVGSFAVLMTLVYLAVQVQQSKKLLEENQRIALSQTFQTRVSYRMETFKFGLEPHGAELLAKFDTLDRGVSVEKRLINFDALSDSEKIQIRNYYSMALQAMENTLYQGVLGLLEDEHLQNARTAIAANYPIWIHSGAVVPPHVEKWYEENCVPSDAQHEV